MGMVQWPQSKLESISYRLKNLRAITMRKILCILFGLGAVIHTSAQGTFTIGSGTTITTSNGTYLVLGNVNLVNNGVLSQATGETIKFTGSTDVTVSGGGSATTGKLMISKTIGSKLNLGADLTVSDQLYFENGLLDLGNNHILLQGAATITGESETARSQTTGTGYIEASAMLNNPSSANIGSLGAIITSPENLGSVTIRRGHQSQMNSFGNGSSIYRYYDIQATNNTNLNATLRLTYADAELNGLNESVLIPWRSIDNINWSAFGADARDVTNNYVEKNGISQFSRWTLSEQSSTLPVKFTYLNTQCNQGSLKITWKAMNLENVKSFSIERSVNGTGWTTIGHVAPTGNSNQEQMYSFLDVNATGSDLYRIVENSMDNKKYYSSIANSSCRGTSTFGVSPNPAYNTFTVNLSSTTAVRNKLTLYNVAGAVVAVKTVDVLPGATQIFFDISTVPAGVYSLVMQSEKGDSRTMKIIKQ